MPTTILSHLQKLAPRIKQIRRDVHMYPETAWTEYRTTALIADFLHNLDYDITLGADVLAQHSTPHPHISATQCAKEQERALQQKANPQWVQRMANGFTGLWADIHPLPENTSYTSQNTENNILALRFDMDANGIAECPHESHLPTQKAFSSKNFNIMHACGHDGHVAIGLGVAEILHSLRHMLHRPVRLIFQPAEETGQGAKLLLGAGVIHNVNELIGLHLGVQATKPSSIICGTSHFLATTSFELSLKGKAVHAGIAPHKGRNALLAALAAAQGILSIARHGDGATRVNIGQFRVDGAPNVIPEKAWFAGETRGLTSEIDTWMLQEVKRISAAAADMWQCTSHLHCVSSCPSGTSDIDLAKDVRRVAEHMPCFTNIVLHEKFLASEDFTWLLNDVQQRGGQGTYIQLGIQRIDNHHGTCFDFDEDALLRGVELLTRIVLQKQTTIFNVFQ